jgi:hypothetical protein
VPASKANMKVRKKCGADFSNREAETTVILIGLISIREYPGEVGSYKILIFRTEDSWLDHISDGFKIAGHNVIELPLHKVEGAQAAADFIKRSRPDFCFGQNFYAFDRAAEWSLEFEEIFQSLRIPMACWFIDQPVSSGSFYRLQKWMKPPYPTYAHFFCADQAHLDFFQTRGLSTSCVRLGVPDRLQNYSPAMNGRNLFSNDSLDFTFLGTPPVKTGARNEEELIWFHAQRAHAQLGDVLLEVAATGQQAAVRERWRTALPTFHEWFRHSFWAPAEYARARLQLKGITLEFLPEDLHHLIEILLGRIDILYSFLQLARLVTALEGKNLQLFGGENWKDISPDAATFSKYLSFDEMLALFAHSKVSLCYTKKQFPSSVVERPLLVWAAGGFPLVDEREDLRWFLSEDSFASYRYPEEAKELFDYYVSRDQERLAMTAKARSQLFDRHKYSDRAKEIISTLQAVWNI